MPIRTARDSTREARSPSARRGAPPSVAALSATLLLVLTAAGCSSAIRDGKPAPEVTATLPLPGPRQSATPEGSGEHPEDTADAPGGEDGPLEGMTVVIDPGHNGGNADAADEINQQVDAGTLMKACDTVGATTEDGYEEHQFNFDLAEELRDRLRARGATVILTRDTNDGVGPCIDERAQIGNDAGADAAISIHADGGPPTGRGFHVITPADIAGYTEDIVGPSARLAEEVRDEFHEGARMPYADYIGDDGLDVRDDLGGLNLSTVPKIFLEAGNLRNAEDAELLSDEEWRGDAAEAVASGITNFLTGD